MRGGASEASYTRVYLWYVERALWPDPCLPMVDLVGGLDGTSTSEAESAQST